jgi:thiamine pyrophosphokinase
MSKKKALLVCGADYGTVPTPEEEAFIRKFDFYVAVDGGIRYLKNRNLGPHLWIGDGDSMTEEDAEWAVRNATRIHVYPYQKDYLDSELAVRTVSTLCEEIGFMGVWGSRIDQSFALTSLLVLSANLGLKAEAFISEGNQGTIVGVCRGPGIYHYTALPKETWSFQPLTECGNVVLEGLQYPLSGETIHREQTRLMSNCSVSSCITVSLDNGDLMFFRILLKDETQETRR